MLHRIYRVLALSLCLVALAFGALAPAALAMPVASVRDISAIPSMPAAPLATCTSTGSGNWDAPSTWTCGQVPTIADDVTILGTHTVTVNVANAAAHNLTVNTGGELALSNNTLTLSGSWYHYGTFYPGTGTVVFTNTTSQQLIGGNNPMHLYNLTVGGAGTGGLTVRTNTPLYIDGDLKIDAGTLRSPNNLYIGGNWITTGRFDRYYGTVHFIRNTTMSGSSAVNLQNVIIEAGGTFTAPTTPTLSVAGDWTNNGTFNHNAGTVWFNYRTTISGTNPTRFNNVQVNLNSILTLTGDKLQVAGFLRLYGSLVAGTGTTVVFAGNTTLSGNASVMSFYNLTIRPGSTLIAPARNVNVYGNWVNNGTFTPGTGTITFAGSPVQTLSGDTPFNNLIVSTGNTLDAGTSIVTFNKLTLLGSSTREVRSVSVGGGMVTFNLAQGAINVTDRGNLTQVEMVRHEWNHPRAMDSTNTGRWWSITPTGTWYKVDLTLLASFTPTLQDGVCRNLPGTPKNWLCFATSSVTANSITGKDIPQLISDWAVANHGLGGLGAELESFTAQPTAAGMALAWMSVSEVNLRGYNLYRSVTGSEQWTLVNETLIPSASGGGTAGGSYHFVDPGVQPGGHYTYRLEALDLDGTTSFPGTLDVVYPDTMQPALRLPNNQPAVPTS